MDWDKLGMEVIGTVNDGVEAYELILEKHPDIVITDIRMPGMDGIELVEKVLGNVESDRKVFFVNWKRSYTRYWANTAKRPMRWRKRKICKTACRGPSKRLRTASCRSWWTITGRPY